ncbi:hypothetical protein [Arthrobacter burdickii]|uniref:Uncharacterized protein n=1 Tax=Arthrobacter burdickii TaxID=3035920 RepID=A0ABT8K2T4_9MICC|nr:hypothetical protein [Arthrobacter burdickii]MDN4611720.1 hypothetical protein [Arthrobacter burdickii]
MTSIDDFEPRILAELAQHAKGLPEPIESTLGLPSDYYYLGARKRDAPTSQLENKDPSELPPPRGKIVSTPQQYLHI